MGSKCINAEYMGYAFMTKEVYDNVLFSS